ncbi:MAG: redoxin domain-containing protein [Desulfuromusa sp.]|nr:redoxin domain-containing protein [Desulfuromusa sp.]
MKNSVTHHILRIVLFALLGALLATTLWAANPINPGKLFPEVPLPAPLDPAQRSYLGLTDNQPFTLSQVEGRIVLVEILNVLCPHCVRQTKPYNQLYRMIEADPETRGRIKMLGVAVANDDEAIDDFVVIYSVAFPVISDRHFKLHKALRAGPTPFSLYLLRDHPDETFVVTDTHLGNDYKMDELFDYLKDLLSMNASEFTSLPQDEAKVENDLRPPQSETEIAEMVKDAFATQGKDFNNFRRLDLSSNRWVYTATITRDGRSQPIFAEVTNRSAICDICHSVHFFYVFDQTGQVLDFAPLHLTKYGNVEWNRAEIDHFARRVVGKRLSGSWNFDPKTDALTSATMTSAIIFDDLGQGRELLEELQKNKLLEP